MNTKKYDISAAVVFGIAFLIIIISNVIAVATDNYKNVNKTNVAVTVIENTNVLETFNREADKEIPIHIVTIKN